MKVGNENIYCLETGYYKIDVDTGRFVDMEGEDFYCSGAKLIFRYGDLLYKIRMGDEAQVKGYVKLVDIDGYNFYLECCNVIETAKGIVIEGYNFWAPSIAADLENGSLKQMDSFSSNKGGHASNTNLAPILESILVEQKKTNQLLEKLISSK